LNFSVSSSCPFPQAQHRLPLSVIITRKMGLELDSSHDKWPKLNTQACAQKKMICEFLSLEDRHMAPLGNSVIVVVILRGDICRYE
jgi:hypothetical protein